MPYERVGAMKITNHHVRSPMLNVNKSCQTCHHAPEDELKERVNIIQDRHLEMRKKAMDALMIFMDSIQAAQATKMDPARIAKAQYSQREAQFLIDFIEAENSTGLHAPQEAARLIVSTMDKIRESEIILRNK
jgi:nitrite reductase (cytochrome c-552)